MVVRYVNHQRKEIDFMKYQYLFQSGSLLDYTWSYEIGNLTKNRIQNIQRSDVSIPVSVSMVGDTMEEFQAAAYELIEATEADVLAQKPGKLYVNDYYLKCYVLQDIPEDWNMGIPYIKRTLYVMPDYPFWCRELTKTFLKGNPVLERDTDGYLYYPFSYAYRYSMPNNTGFLLNDHYAPCDFRLIIYGPCENPAIRINGHLYEVKATLFSGDYLEVDSRDNTVFWNRADGRRINQFNMRNKESSLFEKVAPGRCAVIWNTGAFGFDLTIFQERSEPKWIS